MYNIEKKDYGFRITLSGILSEQESIKIKDEVINAITDFGQEFCMLIDLTNTEILSPAVKNNMLQIQKFCIANGLVRVAKIVNNEITKKQLLILAKKSGLDKFERFFSVADLNYEQEALAWLDSAKEPQTISI